MFDPAPGEPRFRLDQSSSDELNQVLRVHRRLPLDMLGLLVLLVLLLGLLRLSVALALPNGLHVVGMGLMDWGLLALLTAMVGLFWWRGGGRGAPASKTRPDRSGASAGRRRMIRLSLLLLTLAIPRAYADAPQAPPADHVVRSPNGRCAARAEVAAAQVKISGRAPGGEAVSWNVPGWHRVLLVGDDCRLLGVGYPGQDLLAFGDLNAATPVMTFHRDGGPMRVVHLGELYQDLSTLRRTVSHWLWQQGSEWDGRRWTVHTVDGRVLAFAP